MKQLIYLIAITYSLNLLAFENEVQLRQDLSKGLNLLYKNQTDTKECRPGIDCPSSFDKEKIIDEAIELKTKYDNIIKNYKVTDIKWTQLDNLEMVSKFEFASPIIKDNSKSNMIYGYIYRPNLPIGCNIKYPATLLVHHVANNISDEKLIASLATQMHKGVFMIIYLPNYGPRKEDSSSLYFPSEIADFKENLFQSLIDIRVAGGILAQDQMVDKRNLQIGGLSLGGILAATSAGLDPFFNSYFIGLGGGDFAGILTSDKSKLTGVIKDSLQNIKWNRDEARFALSSLDAITWSYRVKNKNITILNARNDEIIDYELSYKKLLTGYAEGNNQVKNFEHDGSHVPDVKELGFKKALKTYVKILGRLFDFLGKNRSAEASLCKSEVF